MDLCSYLIANYDQDGVKKPLSIDSLDSPDFEKKKGIKMSKQ